MSRASRASCSASASRPTIVVVTKSRRRRATRAAATRAAVTRGAVTRGAPGVSLPLAPPAAGWPPLAACADQALQTALEQRVGADSLWSALAGEGKLTIGVVDLSHPGRPRAASLNGERMLYAASLPKIAVLLAACQAFADGRHSQTPAISVDLQLMIRSSDNAAATRMIDRLGFDYIESVLTGPRYRFYDPQHGGGLWVGRRYARHSATHPEPLRGLSHAASAEQVCRFDYRLATGRLIDGARCRQMLVALGDPGLHHMFVGALDRIAPAARVYRKSGSWRRWSADSVLVRGAGARRYILVALVEHPGGGALLGALLPAIDALLVGEPAPQPPPASGS